MDKLTTVLITGATDGIGKQTALEMAASGFEIIVHGRNKKKVEDTLGEILSKTPEAKVFGYTVDYQSLKAVSDFADELRRNHSKIDILFNNAAAYEHKRTETGDGYELNFQVNHLAHMLLTLKIHDLIENAESGRVINVSSMIHASKIDFDNLQSDKNYAGSSAYALSKLCNILFTNKLTRLFADNEVVYLSVHPGVIETKLLNSAFSGGAPTSEGARIMQHAATSPELQTLSGAYVENCRPMQSSTASYDIETQDRLWDLSMDLIEKYL